MLDENTKNGSWLVAPSLSCIYLFGLTFYQLDSVLGISSGGGKNYIILLFHTIIHFKYSIRIEIIH